MSDIPNSIKLEKQIDQKREVWFRCKNTHLELAQRMRLYSTQVPSRTLGGRSSVAALVHNNLHVKTTHTLVKKRQEGRAWVPKFLMAGAFPDTWLIDSKRKQRVIRKTD